MAKRCLVPCRVIAAAAGLGLITALCIAEPSESQPAPMTFTLVEEVATVPLPRRTPIVGLLEDERQPLQVPDVAVMPTPTPSTKPRPKPTSKPKPRSTPVARSTSHSLAGRASWYCRAGVSICHYAYPPGSMVAAACAPLRAAMGPRWRGQTVVVINRNTGGRVVVKLVDYCASRDKAIDLYWEPMRRLGGSGVLPVTVRW